jgi:hypothetical protein
MPHAIFISYAATAIAEAMAWARTRRLDQDLDRRRLLWNSMNHP